MARKPIGVTAQKFGTTDTVIVVCDDGSVWRSYDPAHAAWEAVMAIPGTVAAGESDNPGYGTGKATY